MEPVLHLYETGNIHRLQHTFVKLMYMKLILRERKIQPVRVICTEVFKLKSTQLQMPCLSVFTVSFNMQHQVSHYILQ
jgi:hypothetical protein